jgi:hypothetical protein
MRKHLLAALPLILLGAGSAHCQDSSETALGDPTPAAMVDPSLANSHTFPPSLGTSGVAAAVAAPKPGRGASCSPANPCATPTPARDRVIVTQGGP